MSDTIIFDTHAFVKRGIDAGLTQREAEFFANEQVRLFEHNLATKTDIASLQTDIASLQKETAELKKDIAELKKDTAELKKDTAELKKDTTELKKDTASLHKDLVAVKQDLSDKTILAIRWNVGTMLAVAGLLLGAIKLL
ncbi:MAG: hypothetical protein OXF97_00485 [Nitrospira sp.]|nr:hypothetical protein [Nitrospira sp.]